MYKVILAAIDISDEIESKKIIDVASGLAQKFDATLCLASVVPNISSVLTQYFKIGSDRKILEDTDKILREMTENIVPDSIKTKCIVTNGDVAIQIVKIAQKLSADLIVIGLSTESRKNHLGLSHIGGHANKIIRHTPCSIILNI